MKIYAVTQDGVPTYFATKRDAHRFNSRHDEPAEVETLTFTPAELADMFNELPDESKP
jgi:hypothetical protein